MRTPEIQARLNKIASEIQALSEELSRRTPLKRAPRTSTPMTDKLRSEIRKLAKQYPKMTQREIGNYFNVDAGRVSETLRGYRT